MFKGCDTPMKLSKARCKKLWGRKSFLRVLSFASLSLLLAACEQQQDALAEPSDDNVKPARAAPLSDPPANPGTAEKGVFFRPDLEGFKSEDEYDDDGDGDGIKETHVRRYIDDAGNSAFSLTTNDITWAWSLDTQGDDDSDIHKNYVVRDSNCDGVIDERYSLDAQFHVPDCVEEKGAAEQKRGR
jgi:hypothetical protein